MYENSKLHCYENGMGFVKNERPPTVDFKIDINNHICSRSRLVKKYVGNIFLY